MCINKRWVVLKILDELAAVADLQKNLRKMVSGSEEDIFGLKLSQIRKPKKNFVIKIGEYR